MRHERVYIDDTCRRISIHAPRMGCDLAQTVKKSGNILFQSTHPVWDATSLFDCFSIVPLFQSTHPVWDATRYWLLYQTSQQFQSTHPVWDATSWPATLSKYRSHFNPRTPYGMRHITSVKVTSTTGFQSTHPVWDATAKL